MFRFPPLTPFVKKLLIALFGVFVATLLVERITGFSAFTLLALDPRLSIFTVFQVFTHVLVYPPASGSVLSLLIGLLFLWWIAAPFEQRFGPKATLQVCMAGSLAAGVAAVMGAFLLQPTIMYGLGPLILAVIAAYAMSLPQEAALSFFGILPLKPKALIGLIVGLSALMAIADENYLGFVGDLGATAAGIFYMKWLLTPRQTRPKQARKKRPNGRNHGLRVIEGGASDDDDDDEKPRYLN